MEEDFLAREAAALGGEFTAPGVISDNHDFAASAQAFPDLDTLGDADIPSTLNLPITPSFVRPVSVTDNDDDLASFQKAFPDAPPSKVIADASAHIPVKGALDVDSFINEPEPDVIKEWREKQVAQIAKREASAKKRHETTLEEARKSIDQLYTEINIHKEANIAANKREEAEFFSQRLNSLAKGTTWDRVCDLIDLKNSQSKTTSSKDLPRFKEVLLRLKREGETAVAASGA